MSPSIEGLDPTAEAELDPGEVTADAPEDLGSLRRALRDLEAAKARVQRDADRAAQEMRESLVLDLLPVLDNIDRTIRAAQQSGESEALLVGAKLVRNQLAAVLKGYGVERIDAHHAQFDPAIHEAIAVAPVDRMASHDVVIEQIEPGYKFGSRLLRPAKVVVGRRRTAV
jgi:molecular chaperone GrpE